MRHKRTLNGRRSNGEERSGIRTALAFVLVLPLLSGCVAGMLVRGVKWANDPIPIWVVLWEERGECTVVIDDVLIRHQRMTLSTDVGDELSIGCGHAFVGGKERVTSASFLILGPLQELNRSIPSRERGGPLAIDVDLTSGNGDPLFVKADLYGLRLGQSTFCIPQMDFERLRFVYNAGVSRDVHVLIGAGSRRCWIG